MRQTFYVATNGNDEWSGKQPEPDVTRTDGPFSTLAHAVEASRGLGTEVERRIVVRGGAYYDVALKLDDRDSGLTIKAANGEEPILYGGHLIEGWQQEGVFWSTTLPEVAKGRWDFRMLQVNGQMCPRARLPKTGAFTHESVFDVRWMTSTGGGWEREPTEEELTTLKYKEGDLDPGLDVNNAEVTVYHAWDDSMVGVAAIDEEQRVVKFSTPSGHPPGGFGNWLPHARTYVVWNTREGMHEPGQWYLDRTTGKVIYWPLPDEDLTQIKALAPTTERIFDIAGRDGTPVRNLCLKGLKLAVTNTPLIAAGYGTENLAGAVTGMGPLVDCQFNELKITNVAGNAIKIRDNVRNREEYGVIRARPSGNKDIRIEHCETRMTGAGGFYLTAQDSSITDNLFVDVGVMYPAAIGIRFGGDRIDVSHNEVNRASYDGIAGHFGKGSRVEYNKFTNIMQVLRDGAAIYVFYVEDLVMRGNVTYNTQGGVTRAHAYYLDEFSENCDVAENLSVGLGWPAHNHMAQNCRIWGNVYITDGDVQVTFTRSTDFSMEKNVIYATGKIVFKPINSVTSFWHNVFYSGTGQVLGVEMELYTPGGPITGLKLNPDAPAPREVPLESNAGTLLTDPLFVDVANGDYRFTPASPAAQWGILPIDVHLAGRRCRS